MRFPSSLRSPWDTCVTFWQMYRPSQTPRLTLSSGQIMWNLRLPIIHQLNSRSKGFAPHSPLHWVSKETIKGVVFQLRLRSHLCYTHHKGDYTPRAHPYIRWRPGGLAPSVSSWRGVWPKCQLAYHQCGDGCGQQGEGATFLTFVSADMWMPPNVLI